MAAVRSDSFNIVKLLVAAGASLKLKSTEVCYIHTDICWNFVNG
jgi:hypothetical protein